MMVRRRPLAPRGHGVEDADKVRCDVGTLRRAVGMIRSVLFTKASRQLVALLLALAAARMPGPVLKND